MRLFDLILCRYVALTYFAVPLQRKVLASMLKWLRPQGYLVIGTHEQLPSNVPELDAADQVAKCRMQFFNDRSGLAAVLSDEDIDFVAVEWTAGSDFARLTAVILALEDISGEMAARALTCIKVGSATADWSSAQDLDRGGIG